MAFHETRFPTDISFGARGGPKRRTIIGTSGSGFEHRNAQWADSRREYNAGYGIKTINDVHTIIEFFEERNGRLHGFRWKDKTDFKSTAPQNPVAFNNQTIGTGNGTNRTFQITKTYGTTFSPYTRNIKKTVSGTVVVGVNGVQQVSGWTVDNNTGIITFTNAPPNTQAVTAGYEFDVPVRFGTDFLEIDYSHFDAGSIPDIPIVEIRL